MSSYNPTSDNMTIIMGNKNTDRFEWRGFGYKNENKLLFLEEIHQVFMK